MVAPTLAFTNTGVTKTHNGFFIVHFTYNNNTGGGTQTYAVAVRNYSEFYIEAIRVISGFYTGSDTDTALLNFSTGTVQTELAKLTLPYDTSS